MSQLLQAALKYRNDLGYSVIPMGPDQKPLIDTTKYSKNLPTEDEIRSWWDKWPNARLAVALSALSGLSALIIGSDEKELIPDSLETPIMSNGKDEQTYFFRHNRQALFFWYNKQALGGWILVPPSKGYDGEEIAWLPKLKPTEVELAEIPEALFQHYKAMTVDAVAEVEKGKTSRNVTESHVSLRFSDRKSVKTGLTNIANLLNRGGIEAEKVSDIITILGQNCYPPYKSNELTGVVSDILMDTWSREKTLSAEVRDWLESTKGNFLVSDCHRDLHIRDKQEKNNFRTILNRLLNEGAIEHTGRRGQYRTVDSEVEILNWYDADVKDSIPIQYPLDIHEYCLTLPKNIVIVAGEKDTGKTALLLGTAALNRNTLRPRYFTSEMGEVEFKQRMVNVSEKLHIPLDELQRKVTVINRAGNFDDQIYPNDLNIIDFLEIHDNFYEIGGLIRRIFDKLENGVAVIGIQKPQGRKTPLGGDRGLEKARIAIALSPGEAEIVVGKNWATSENPKGLVCRYKLIQGALFQLASPWDKARSK
jgi:hypothetical protein